MFHITNILAAFIGKKESNMVTAQICEWASTKRQLILVMYVR